MHHSSFFERYHRYTIPTGTSSAEELNARVREDFAIYLENGTR